MSNTITAKYVSSALANAAQYNDPQILYYTFNGQRVAMQKGYDFFYLHGDHLGSTNSVTDRKGVIVNNGAQRYWGYGRTRTTWGTPTDHTYTGQKSDTVTGLLYYNARYYDPQIGQFVSPDTIVPDPTNLYDYQRYAYGKLNPMQFNDPSGHYAICFQEGFAPGEESTVDTSSGVYNICSELAAQNLFGKSGQYRVFGNTPEGQSLALEWLAEMQKQYPDEEFTLIGYSYGGGAALEFARMLETSAASGLGIENHIDNLVTIDPVVGARWLFGRMYYPAQVTWFTRPFDNVERGYNILATEHRYGFILPLDQSVRLPQTNKGNIDHELVPHTNHCTIAFANCSGGFASSGFSHIDDGSGQPNPDTVDLIVDFLSK